MNTNKMILLLSASALLLLILSSVAAADLEDGSEDYPYLIDDAAEFAAIRNDLNAHYKLNNSIDLTGSGFLPIGDTTTPFTGSLKGGTDLISGDSYTIFNFEYTGTNEIGLFGYAEDAEFSDLVLVNITITGDNRTGALVGRIENTVVEQCVVYDSVLLSNESGMVGFANNSTIVECQAVNVSHNGSIAIGGILGLGNNTTITDCHSDGHVEGEVNVGGLAGHFSNSIIADSSFSGTIKSYRLSPFESQCVGGLVGLLQSSDITNSSVSASIQAGSERVGGLVGRSDASNINDSYVTVVINSIGQSNAGGLVAVLNSSNLTRSYVTDSTINSSGYFLGGLVGQSNKSNLTESYVSNTTINGTGFYIGGLVGTLNSSNLTASYINSTVYGRHRFVGGLVGYSNNSTIGSSFMAGDVKGEEVTSNRVGGLIGSADSSSEIFNCYVTGDVKGNESVGGLIGFQSGEVRNCFALNEFVNGTTSVGRLYGTSDADRTTYSFAWENMTNGGTEFTDGGNNGTTITSAEVWRNYPNSGWGNWDSSGLWVLNEYNKFLLPVHTWTDKNIVADATHLVSKYYVTYDGNTYTSGTVPVDSTAYLNDIDFKNATILGAGDMEKENHTFTGWNTEADGSGHAYAADSTREMSSNVTLYAQWTEILSNPGGNGGGGSGVGNAVVINGSNMAGIPESPVVIPLEPGSGFEDPEAVKSPLIILLFMIAIAVFCFRRVVEEKEDAEDERLP